MVKAVAQRPTSARKVALAGRIVDDVTESFIREHGLQEGIDWVRSAVPTYFGGVDFEIDLSIDGDEGSVLISLRIRSPMSVGRFRKCAHALYEALRDQGYAELYDVLGITHYSA